MYSYEKQKEALFTDDGQRLFLRVRDKVQTLLKTSGAFRLEEAMSGISSCDSWELLACFDRLVELEEIREVTKGQDIATQHRVYIKR